MKYDDRSMAQRKDTPTPLCRRQHTRYSFMAFNNNNNNNNNHNTRYSRCVKLEPNGKFSKRPLPAVCSLSAPKRLPRRPAIAPLPVPL